MTLRPLSKLRLVATLLEELEVDGPQITIMVKGPWLSTRPLHGKMLVRFADHSPIVSLEVHRLGSNQANSGANQLGSGGGVEETANAARDGEPSTIVGPAKVDLAGKAALQLSPLVISAVGPEDSEGR